MKTLEMYHIIFPFTRHLALIVKGEFLQRVRIGFAKVYTGKYFNKPFRISSGMSVDSKLS